MMIFFSSFTVGGLASVGCAVRTKQHSYAAPAPLDEDIFFSLHNGRAREGVKE
jgi:hypothetical protein